MIVWLITFLAIVFVILAAGAKKRASRRYNLPQDTSVALAILKENLLENPCEAHLAKLKEFAESKGLSYPSLAYPLTKAASIQDDDDLFLLQAGWLDCIKPLEFKNEPQTENDILQGILRYYSDKEIFAAFKILQEKFPSEKNKSLEQEYKNLCELRDSSKTDYDSLEKLRIEKEKWERNMRESFP